MKEVEMEIAALDSDRDGLLSLEDFIALMEVGGEEQKLNDLKVEEAKEHHLDEDALDTT